MSLIKWQGNGGSWPVLSRFFDDFWNDTSFDWNNRNFSSTSTTVPSVNIKETENDYEVEMAAPGMKKEDFQITLDGNLLMISSEKRFDNEEQNEQYTRKEFSYQSFQRSFQLPKDVVDEESIQAKYEDGVLRLIVPKKEEAKKKAPRRIEIG